MIETEKLGAPSTPGVSAAGQTAVATLSALATVRAGRPDLADWCERAPAVASLFVAAPWASRWALLPDASAGTAMLLIAWAGPAFTAATALPEPLAALAQAQALAARAMPEWPAGAHSALVARCLVGLSDAPTAVVRCLAVAQDVDALQAALDEPAALALDATALLDGLPAAALAPLLAAANDHSIAPAILAAAYSAGCAAPEQAAALVAGLLPHNPREARALAEAIVAAWPNHLGARVALARACNASGDRATAARLLPLALAELDCAAAACSAELAAAEAALGHPEKARAAWARALARNPKLGQAAVALASHAQAAGRTAQAERVLATAIARAEPAELPAMLPGLFDAGFETPLRAALARAAVTSADAPLVAYYSGLMYQRDGALAEARNALARSVVLAPGWPAPRLAHAELLRALGNLPEAAADYAVVLQREPASARALAGLSQVRAAQGDLPAAIALAETLVQSAPPAATHYALLAEMLLAAGRAGEAVPAARAATECDPALEHAVRLARAQLATGAADLAITTLQAARANTGDHPAILPLLAASAEAARDWATALEAWTAQFLHGRDAASARGAAHAARAAGDLALARAWFARALRCDPTCAAAWVEVATLHRECSRPRAAVRAYIRALRAGAPPSTQRSLAQAYVWAGDPIAAIDCLESYLGTTSQDAIGWHLLGRLRLHQGDRAGALHVAERLAGLASLPAPVACWMIDTLASAGLRGRARELADAAIAAAPQDAALRVRRAGLSLDAGAIAEARADALAALTRQRDLAPARIILGRIQLREAAYGAARATLAPLADDPQNADAVSSLLAEALEGCGAAAEALPYARRALQSAPSNHGRLARLARLLLATGEAQSTAALLQGPLDHAELLILRAQACIALGEHAPAERDAQAAARLAPENPAIALVAATFANAKLAPFAASQQWAALAQRFPGDDATRQRAAQAMLEADDAAAAIALLLPLVERGAASAATAGLLGRAYVRAGRTQDGVRTLRYAVRQAPDAAQRAETQLALAEAYLALGWTEDACATLDALLADVPDHALALRGRARLALDADRLADAEADLARLAGDDPDTAELRAMLAARQGDWARAITAQRHACAVAPSAKRLTRLSELCDSAGDWAARIAALEALAQHSPDPANWANVAQAYAAADNRPAARAAWEQALTDRAPAAWWAGFGGLLAIDGDRVAARAAFRRALANDPTDTASAAVLADLTDIPAERVELLQQATEQAPADGALWGRLAQALAATGASAEARRALHQAAALSPHDPDAALAYAEALLASDKRLAAVETLEQACSAPAAPARLLGRLAAVLTEGLPFIGDLVRLPIAADPARQRLVSRAVSLLAQARQRDPSTLAWWLQAARLQVVAGDYRAARNLLSELNWQELDPADQSSALVLRAAALAHTGSLAEAAADARQVLDSPDAAAMQVILAEAAYVAGDVAAAHRHAQAARAAGADSPAQLATLGLAALALGHAAEACEALELALEQGTDASWLDALSQAYAQLDRRERALEYAARAVRAAPNVAAYQQHLASLYQQQSRLHDARAALIRALSLQPDVAIWHAQMAEICDALGMTQAATQSLEHARALAPRDPAIVVIGAQLRAAQGDAIGALASYRQALAIAPDRIDWQVAAAKLAQASGQAASFLEHARSAVEQAPSQAAGWQLLADAVHATSDAAAALAVLEQGLARCAGDRGLTLCTVRAALALNNPARAQTLLDAWLDRAPEDAEAWELAGAATQALGDPDSARRALERAIRIAPRQASAHAGLARLALSTDDPATALRAAANASNYDPVCQGHAVLLARALQVSQRLDEARSVIRPVLPEALPKDAELCRWYAELHLLDGAPSRAIAALELAIGYTPDLPELHLWAGRAHRQQRHYRRAITHLRRAIRLRPSYPEAIIELSSLGPLAFAAHAARGDSVYEELVERIA